MAKYKIIPSSRTIVQSPISIGHKAEKGVEAIEFDLTAWVETYGSGTLTVIMRRWGDAIPYPIALEIDENNKATWTLSDTDTAKAGMAYAQLSYIVGDEVVKKSDIYTFRVMDSLTGEGEPPEAYESWLEHLTHLAAEAMAEVLDIEGVVTDKTLTVDGGIADGKATGDALSALEDQFTEETDKLKADLGAEISNVSEGYAYLPIVYNEYVKTNGDFAPYNGWFRTPKIAIPDNAKWLLIYIPANTQYSAWYDRNGSFISSLNLAGDAGWKKKQIPTGAKYFAISNDKQYVGKYLYCGNEKTTELFNFLLSDFVINATQSVTMNSEGKPTGISYKRDGTTIREDTIEYSDNAITEHRTDSATGIYVTITTNLTTLETTVN